MMISASGPRAGHDAAALRFLALCLGGWILLRVAMSLDPAAPLPPRDAMRPWRTAEPSAAMDSHDAGQSRKIRASSTAGASPLPAAGPFRIAGRRDGASMTAPMDADGDSVDPEGLRLAKIAGLLPSSTPATGAIPERALGWGALSSHAADAPGRGQPFWMQRPLARWSLGGWLYLRDGTDRAPDGIAAGGQLGGSQAGLRLAYGFGDRGRLRAYTRATMAIERPRQREVAFGAAFEPLPRLPVDIAVEQRIAIGREGRTALAAMLVDGVSEVVLPARFRLDAYAQAGMVGLRRHDGFAEGMVVVDRQLGGNERVRLGALAAGSVQPDAARVDVGPRLTFRLPDVGKGSRVALDWRQRVAGDAHPESGLSLTLAADF